MTNAMLGHHLTLILMIDIRHFVCHFVHVRSWLRPKINCVNMTGSISVIRRKFTAIHTHTHIEIFNAFNRK